MMSMMWMMLACNTPQEHARQCEQELGAIPSFDCADGVVVPILVDGVEVEVDPPGLRCDDPAVADANCSVGSRVGRVEGERPEVKWVYLCRNGDRMVQLIGHDTESGATCFFETEWQVDQQSDALTVEDGLVRGPLPGPDDPSYADVWKAPRGVAFQRCWTCHGADPFVHSPYIDGARLEHGETVVPEVAGAESPYFLVGDAFELRERGENSLRTVHIEGNGCLGCHRFVDVREFGEEFEEPWDINARMPPDDPGSMSDDYEALLTCLDDGPENTEGCAWRDVPGG